MAVNTHPPPPPLAPPPSSSRVSSGAIERAVQALLKWKDTNSKTQKASLLEPDDFVYLILTLKKIPANARTNPFKIPLPHPLIDPATAEICLVIDDRPKSGLTKDAAQKKIKSEGVPVAKVLKLSKLRTNYRPFEAKRKLCDSYDMFLADRRVVGMLPRLLGKQFFKKKKIPVGVDLRHKSWKEQVERVCASALLFVGTGTCSVLKVGRVSMGKEEIVANVAAALEGVVEVVPRKWRNVRSFHLKLLDSLALPVYQALPDVKLKIEGLKDKEDKKEEEEEEEGMNEVVEEGKGSKSLAKKKGAKKGRIHEVRYMDTNLNSLVDEEDEDIDDLDMVEVQESDDNDKDETDGSKIKGKKGKLKKEGDVCEWSGEKISKKSAKSKKEGDKKTKTTLSGGSKKGDSVKKTKKSNLTVKEGEVSKDKKEKKRKIKV